MDVDELESMDENVWHRNKDISANDCPVQKKKMALNKPKMLGNHTPTLTKIMSYLNNQEFIDWLTELTGIRDLEYDSYYAGAGIHRTNSGGKLDLHVDFSVHPFSKKIRRINILLYLNQDWKAEWGGGLQLWCKRPYQKVKTVDPLFNTIVIFNTTLKALHGHPEPLTCPENRSRISLAYYYYTSEKPRSLEVTPGTIWFKTP